MMKTARALALAITAHWGERDKADKLAIWHPMRVGLRAFRIGRETGDGLRAMAVGFLHDTVEDTEVTLAEIRAKFGDDIADGVEAVTRHEEAETYKEFVHRSMKHRLGRIVKRADLLDNMNRDGPKTDPKWHPAMRVKWARALAWMDGRET